MLPCAGNSANAASDLPNEGGMPIGLAEKVSQTWPAILFKLHCKLLDDAQGLVIF